MCVKLRGTKIGPGSVFPVRQKEGKSSSLWGFGPTHSQYNARSERLKELYKDCKRGIISTDSFWEGDREFIPVDRKIFSIPVILNWNNEFAVLTRDSNELVARYHHRMPVLLDPDREDKFLDGEFNTWLWLSDYLVTERGAKLTFNEAASITHR